MQAGSEVRTCSKCGGPRAVGSDCKPCKRVYMREFQRRRRLRPEVKEQDREVARKYRANHPEAVLRTIAYVKEKQEWVRTLKQAPCQDCMGSFPPVCMDFDHVRGTKSMGVGIMASQSSRPDILAEIAKCDVVCACCHRVRTEQRRGALVTTPSEARTKIRELKQDAPCKDCGKCYPPVAMDFDHVRGQKTATISQMTSAKWRRVPWDDVVVELDKCDLVCANCHRVRSCSRGRLS